MAAWLLSDISADDRQLKAIVRAYSQIEEPGNGGVASAGEASIVFGARDIRGRDVFLSVGIQSLLVAADPPYMEWLISTSDGGTYIGRKVTSDSVQVTVEAVGTVKRYGRIRYSDDSEADNAGDHISWLIADILPEPAGHSRIEWQDRVESWDVSLTLGSDEPITFTVTPMVPSVGVGIEFQTACVTPRSHWAGLEYNDSDFQWYRPYGTDFVHATAHDCRGHVWVEGSWSRKFGDVENACQESRSYYWNDSEGNGVEYTSEMQEHIVDAGTFSLAWGCDGHKYEPPPGLVDPCGTSFTVSDIFGPYTVGETPDLRNMDGVARSSTIQGIELKPHRVETLVQDGDPLANYPSDPRYTVNYNGMTGAEDNPINVWSYSWDGEVPQTTYPVNYLGKMILLSSCPHAGEEFVDSQLPVSTYDDDRYAYFDVFQHGNRTINNIVPVGDTEGSMHEPAHGPWEPVPSAGQEYADNISLMISDPPASRADALTLTLAAPGTVVATPLQFASEALTWAESDCTTEIDSGRQKVTVAADVTTAYIEDADTLAAHIRLGLRFAVVNWQSDRAGAEAVLHIGQHAWNLTATGTGAQATEIDLCRPDTPNGDLSGTLQSIIGREQPFDLSGYGGVRKADSEYDWDLDAGWGVGRVVSIKIECKTPDTAYWFESIEVIRKSHETGGYAQLYVVPQAGPWNDSCAIDDFAWQPSGHIGANPVSAIVKGFLVIDGMVVWELLAAYVRPGYVGYDARYFKLTRALADGGIGCPLDDYATPTEYAVNGAISAVTSGAFDYDSESPAETDFVNANCLVTDLDGGVYDEVLVGGEWKIGVGMRIQPRHWDIAPGMQFLPKGSFHRFRGQAHGLAWTSDGTPDTGLITEELIGGSTGEDGGLPVYGEALGNYIFEAVNTRGQAEIESVSPGGPTCVDLRSRHYSRAARIGSNCRHLSLRYCSTTGRIVLTPGGKPALTCCE